ncbi:MAG: 2,3-bisphosphoglycerate-dependent phosphoglycerate mutase [Desulfurella sp.]|uniref:2,3-bisphosphoglycerate-dependent phosphoglycerate mutase n=1 Tax=Desulfurella sp. TaxID=1962857 RepID=UPI003D0A94AA
MSHLILIRHGQSIWNDKNLFTGWVDIPLSQKGIFEALNAGEKLSKFNIDIVYTSKLARAIQTALILLSKLDTQKTPVIIHTKGKMKKWSNYASSIEIIPIIQKKELNERYYGTLQGLNKKEVGLKYGEQQLKLWRRSFDVAPPGGESLKDNLKRTLPFFKQKVVEQLDSGKDVLIVAHGNSLRAITKYIENLDENQIIKVEIPTGTPIVYNYENKIFKNKVIL